MSLYSHKVTEVDTAPLRQHVRHVYSYRTKHIGINYFPAYYQVPTNFMKATNAYAPRQLQFAVRMSF
jgi:hypothetical protein